MEGLEIKIKVTRLTGQAAHTIEHVVLLLSEQSSSPSLVPAGEEGTDDVTWIGLENVAVRNGGFDVSILLQSAAMMTMLTLQCLLGSQQQHCNWNSIVLFLTIVPALNCYLL